MRRIEGLDILDEEAQGIGRPAIQFQILLRLTAFVSTHACLGHEFQTHQTIDEISDAGAGEAQLLGDFRTAQGLLPIEQAEDTPVRRRQFDF